jgi:heme/copper-type cytochrome/quinol oxidase subunit 2
MQVVAIVIVALIALSGVYYYFAVYNKPSTGFFSERVRIDIGGALINATDPSQDVQATYYPDNFTVANGAHITLAITNTDNVTHGLSVPKFNIDTGPMQPNATAMLSFVASPAGTYTYIEPSVDCGGGNCDAGQAMNGTFTVAP